MRANLAAGSSSAPLLLAKTNSTWAHQSYPLKYSICGIPYIGMWGRLDSLALVRMSIQVRSIGRIASLFCRDAYVGVMEPPGASGAEGYVYLRLAKDRDFIRVKVETTNQPSVCRQQWNPHFPLPRFETDWEEFPTTAMVGVKNRHTLQDPNLACIPTVPPCFSPPDCIKEIMCLGAYLVVDGVERSPKNEQVSAPKLFRSAHDDANWRCQKPYYCEF